MKNHIIVCGMGQVGYRVVDLLRRLGEPVRVITLKCPRDEWIREVREHGIEVTIGDAREERLLLAAGLADARALIAATDQDLVNIEIALDAVRVRPRLTVVVRLFDKLMARHLEASFDIRRALGMSSLAAPTFAAAALGEQSAATFDIEHSTFVVGRHKVESSSPVLDATVEQLSREQRLFVIAHEPRAATQATVPSADVRLAADDKVVMVAEKQAWLQHFGSANRMSWKRQASQALASLNPRVWLGYLGEMWGESPLSIRTVFIVFNILILTSVFVFHHFLHLEFVDALYFVVTTVTTVGYGDITLHGASDLLKLYGCCLMLLGSATMAMLFSIVTDFVVTSRFQQLLGQQRIPDRDHVIIVGVGNLGFHTAEELTREGRAVVGIDRDQNRDFVENLRHQVPVLVGDGRLASVLSRAGVQRAEALVATTSDDLVNLAVAMAARQLNPRIRTVVRLFDPEFARKVEGLLNVDVAQSDSRIAAPTFVAAALQDGVQGAFIRHQTMFMVVHVAVKEDWQGMTPDQLQARQITLLLRRAVGENVYAAVASDVPLGLGDQVVGVIQRELAS